MKFILNSARQLYVPETEDEARPIRVVLEQMVNLVCHDFRVWDRDDSRDGPWFAASACVPVSRKTGLEPAIVIVQVALPTTFEEDAEFVCRRHKRMTTESLDWLVLCLDNLVYGSDAQPFTREMLNDSMLVRYVQQLNEPRLYEEWRRRQPHRFLRRSATEVTPSRQPVLESLSPEIGEVAPPTAEEIIGKIEIPFAVPDNPGAVIPNPKSPQTEASTNHEARRARRRNRRKNRK